MESLAASEPLPRAPLGCESRARCDTRAETLYTSRSEPRLRSIGTPRHTTLANRMVQLCTSGWGRVHRTYRAWPGGSRPCRRRHLLRHRATVGFSWLQWSRICRIWHLADRIVSSASGYPCCGEPARTAISQQPVRLCTTSAAAIYDSMERQLRAGTGKIAGLYGLLRWLTCVEVAAPGRVSPRQQPKLTFLLLDWQRFNFGLRLVTASIPTKTKPRIDCPSVLHLVSLS